MPNIFKALAFIFDHIDAHLVTFHLFKCMQIFSLCSFLRATEVLCSSHKITYSVALRLSWLCFAHLITTHHNPANFHRNQPYSFGSVSANCFTHAHTRTRTYTSISNCTHKINVHQTFKMCSFECCVRARARIYMCVCPLTIYVFTLRIY